MVHRIGEFVRRNRVLILALYITLVLGLVILLNGCKNDNGNTPSPSPAPAPSDPSFNGKGNGNCLFWDYDPKTQKPICRQWYVGMGPEKKFSMAYVITPHGKAEV